MNEERFEKVLSFVFGIIAVVAALIEMVLGEFSVDSIVAAIKDISGTAVIIILFVAFFSQNKKSKGIRGSIESAMISIEESYFPLIREATVTEKSTESRKNKLNKVIRYEIASDIKALFGTQCNNYAPFFDINAEKPTHIEFYIRKKFFSETSENPFNAETIYKNIELYMNKRYEGLNIVFSPDSNGGKCIIKFETELKYKSEIDKLINIIDDMVFVYTVESKK